MAYKTLQLEVESPAKLKLMARALVPDAKALVSGLEIWVQMSGRLHVL